MTPAYNLSELSVLIVEDNSHMQLLLKEILRSFNIRNIRTALDGVDGLKELKTFTADLVIADWNMEVLDGLEFTRMVRSADDSRNPYVPIIMLTGHTETHHIVEARDAGMTEYLAKPISAKSLYERICSVIEKPRQFIKTRTYAGPDRRRSKPTAKTNKGRRASDKSDGDTVDKTGE
jgi:two-component system chemotaxis response regulator CheY